MWKCDGFAKRSLHVAGSSIVQVHKQFRAQNSNTPVRDVLMTRANQLPWASAESQKPRCFWSASWICFHLRLMRAGLLESWAHHARWWLGSWSTNRLCTCSIMLPATGRFLRTIASDFHVGNVARFKRLSTLKNVMILKSCVFHLLLDKSMDNRLFHPTVFMAKTLSLCASAEKSSKKLIGIKNEGNLLLSG